jgi:iron complex transport system substrate-binding protein
MRKRAPGRKTNRQAKRIVSLLPAATEIAAELGLINQIVGVSHECDYPITANDLPCVISCNDVPINGKSREIDQWVRDSMGKEGSIYKIDESLLRQLRPDVILTQQLCDVCESATAQWRSWRRNYPGRR